MFKIMERLIDLHMRQTVDRSLLSVRQHAYTKARSVETALHKLLSTLEYSLYHRELFMVAFLDIEVAFKNISPQAILNELHHLGVQPLLKAVIDQLLRCRIIKTTLGYFSVSLPNSHLRKAKLGPNIGKANWEKKFQNILLYIIPKLKLENYSSARDLDKDASSLQTSLTLDLNISAAPRKVKPEW